MPGQPNMVCNHCPAQKLTDSEPRDGDSRDERILQRIVVNDLPLRDAAGTRRADVVLLEHIDHAASHLPRDDRELRIRKT